MSRRPERSAKLTWWVPLWGRERITRRNRRDLVGNWSLWQVGLAAAGLIALSLVPFLRRLLDAFLWKALFAVAAFAVGGWLGVLVPQRVRVGSKQLYLPKSTFGGVTIERESVSQAKIIVFDRDRVALKITYDDSGTRRTASAAVSPEIDLQTLCEALPVEPEVIDARSRYARAAGRAGQSVI